MHLFILSYSYIYLRLEKTVDWPINQHMTHISVPLISKLVVVFDQFIKIIPTHGK